MDHTQTKDRLSSTNCGSWRKWDWYLIDTVTTMRFRRHVYPTICFRYVPQTRSMYKFPLGLLCHMLWLRILFQIATKWFLYLSTILWRGKYSAKYDDFCRVMNIICSSFIAPCPLHNRAWHHLKGQNNVKITLYSSPWVSRKGYFKSHSRPEKSISYEVLWNYIGSATLIWIMEFNNYIFLCLRLLSWSFEVSKRRSYTVFKSASRPRIEETDPCFPPCISSVQQPHSHLDNSPPLFYQTLLEVAVDHLSDPPVCSHNCSACCVEILFVVNQWKLWYIGACPSFVGNFSFWYVIR